MDANYEKLVQGIDAMGEALIAIGRSPDNKPIKLLASRLIGKLGFNNPEIGDDIAMIRFAVANDDESLEKLTANITAGGNAAIKATPDVETKSKVKEVKATESKEATKTTEATEATEEA